MPTDPIPADSDLRLLQEVTTAAAAMFTAPRRRAAAASYLQARGIEPGALPDTWPLGYAPPGWTRLLDTLAGQFPDETLLASGLARRSSRGTLIDTFRDRVIFPIYRPDGHVAGFVGRDLSGASHAPRYLNTHRHPLFDKSALLYGLHEAQTSDTPVRQPALRPPAVRQPVVVGGPLDVLAIAAAAGQDRPASGLLPVAACGTAFTIAHARQLAESMPHAPVVVAMDGDAAGRSAATTAGDLLRHAGLEAYIAVLPNGLDPAELLSHGGSTAAFTPEQALPLLTVQVERAIAAQGDRMQWIEGRLAAGRVIASYLSTYPVEHAARHIGWISRALDVAPSTFTQELAEAFLTSHPAGRLKPVMHIESSAAPAAHSLTR